MKYLAKVDRKYYTYKNKTEDNINRIIIIIIIIIKYKIVKNLIINI
jgi:hypothetical protein